MNDKNPFELLSIHFFVSCEDFLCRGQEFGGIGSTGREQRGDGAVSFDRQDISVSLLDFLNQAMRTQQSELAGNGGGLAAGFLVADVLLVEQQRTKVSVAEAVDRKLATVDGLE